MARLKYKTQTGWTTVTKSFPLDVPIITGMSTLPDVPTAGDFPISYSSKAAFLGLGTSYTDTGISITIPKGGTYRFKWGVNKQNETVYTKLYKNGTGVDASEKQTSTDDPENFTYDLWCSRGDMISVWGYKASGNGNASVSGLIACINWDPTEVV